MEENSEDKRCWKKSSKWIISRVKRRIPIIAWLSQYKWKEDILADISAGITLMFLNVPQGLAFSVLANVDLMFGLYTSCIGSFLYCLFGTATISSFGPVAVGSMLTGDAVLKIMASTDYTANDIAIVITFLIGVWYLIAYILKLGAVAIIFRKPFVSGFITACAFQIIMKTVKMVLGIEIPQKIGPLAFFYNFYALIENYNLINYPTVIISIVVFTILILNQCVFRHMLAKHTNFVFPIEAFVMLLVTVLSYLLNFQQMGVPVVGSVPTGFPVPQFPKVNMIFYVWHSSLVIALVNYATTVSMTLLFNESMKTNQELFAMAVVNLVCCNFQCITIGNSMMRTVVVLNLGVKSLLATAISSFLLIFVILFAGPLFQPLPNCVLGCIIIVSIGQLLIQRIKVVKSIWQSSLENGFIWAASLSLGLLVDLQVSMIAGAVLSLRQILSEVFTQEKLEKVRLEKEKENIENSEPETDALLQKNGKHSAKIV